MDSTGRPRNFSRIPIEESSMSSVFPIPNCTLSPVSIFPAKLIDPSSCTCVATLAISIPFRFTTNGNSAPVAGSLSAISFQKYLSYTCFVGTESMEYTRFFSDLVTVIFIPTVIQSNTYSVLTSSSSLSNATATTQFVCVPVLSSTYVSLNAPLSPANHPDTTTSVSTEWIHFRSSSPFVRSQSPNTIKSFVSFWTMDFASSEPVVKLSSPICSQTIERNFVFSNVLHAITIDPVFASPDIISPSVVVPIITAFGIWRIITDTTSRRISASITQENTCTKMVLCAPI